MVTELLNETKKVFKEGIIIETDGINFDQDEQDVDYEQNLEEEATRLIRSWERSDLLREVEEERPKFEMKKDDDYVNYYDGTHKFEDLKKEMIPLGEYVHYRVLEDYPDGEKITQSDTVLHDRISFLEFNPIPFESTIHDGKPAILRLAEGPIIAGLLLAMLELRKGSRAEIIIHPFMAYGTYGCPPLIPKDSHILVNIKIHKVWGESDLDAALAYEHAWHCTFPLEEKIKLAVKQKDAANQYLSDDQPKEALVRYKAAIMWLGETPEDDIAHNSNCKQLLNILYQNKAITLNRLGAYKSATKAARSALSIDSRNVKAMYQLAKARVALGDNDRALRVLEKAKAIAPNNPDIRQLQSQIDATLVDEKRKRDEIMKKMARACIY